METTTPPVPSPTDIYGKFKFFSHFQSKKLGFCFPDAIFRDSLPITSTSTSSNVRCKF
jgi:hypothetical protein